MADFQKVILLESGWIRDNPDEDPDTIQSHHSALLGARNDEEQTENDHFQSIDKCICQTGQQKVNIDPPSSPTAPQATDNGHFSPTSTSKQVEPQGTGVNKPIQILYSTRQPANGSYPHGPECQRGHYLKDLLVIQTAIAEEIKWVTNNLSENPKTIKTHIEYLESAQQAEKDIFPGPPEC
jgi:hypothetical protein